MAFDHDSLPYDVKPRELKTESPFKDLFPINKATLEAITESMREHGYDAGFPLIVWNGVIVDGHTRLLAAKRAGVSLVRCNYRMFTSEDDAIDFAIRSQRNRRNLTDADILHCVATLDERRKKGNNLIPGPHFSDASSEASEDPPTPVRSSVKTAALLGVGRCKVEKARQVLDHAPEKLKQAVMKGEKTIHAAVTEIREARKPAPAPEPAPLEVEEPEYRITVTLALKTRNADDTVRKIESAIRNAVKVLSMTTSTERVTTP